MDREKTFEIDCHRFSSPPLVSSHNFRFGNRTTIFTKTMEKNNLVPPFLDYAGQKSYFGGEPPLDVKVGYFVVLGFGLFFSILTTLLVFLNKKYGKNTEITSEHFK